MSILLLLYGGTEQSTPAPAPAPTVTQTGGVGTLGLQKPKRLPFAVVVTPDFYELEEEEMLVIMGIL